jgi:hypothetical protein|tara:strand:+ start:642 stop:800 length:159 start_codon:yes stop_codon:yes gene_type:complete
MRDKPVNNKWIDDLDKAAAKHLVKLGVEKDWKDVLGRMRKRRERRWKRNTKK